MACDAFVLAVFRWRSLRHPKPVTSNEMISRKQALAGREAIVKRGGCRRWQAVHIDPSAQACKQNEMGRRVITASDSPTAAITHDAFASTSGRVTWRQWYM